MIATSIEKIAREARLNPYSNTMQDSSPESEDAFSDITARSPALNLSEDRHGVQAMLKSQIEDRRLEELYWNTFGFASPSGRLVSPPKVRPRNPLGRPGRLAHLPHRLCCLQWSLLYSLNLKKPLLV